MTGIEYKAYIVTGINDIGDVAHCMIAARDNNYARSESVDFGFNDIDEFNDLRQDQITVRILRESDLECVSESDVEAVIVLLNECRHHDLQEPVAWCEAWLDQNKQDWWHDYTFYPPKTDKE